MKKTIFGILFMVLLIVAGLGIQGHLSDRQIPVTTIKVDRGPVTTYVAATGSVIDREELTVVSPVLAQVLSIGPSEGEAVEKGQSLAALDSQEIQVQLSKAEAALKYALQSQSEAKTTWEHLQAIYEVGGESRKAVGDAWLRWQNARKEVSLAQEEVVQAKAQFGRYQLVAPANGVVIGRAARAGTWVRPGDVLFRIAPNGFKEIEVKLDASDSAAAVVGKPVLVSSDAFPGKEWPEKVTWVAPATNRDAASNALGIRISLGKDAPPLVLGQQVDVKIATAVRENVIRIPSNAIVSRQGKSMAATIADGRVRFVPVSVGAENLLYTEITGSLQEGQEIIKPEGKPLRDGEKVTPILARDKQ